MENKTGLCKYCKNQSWWCGDNHYCDGNNGFRPFQPVDGLKISREEIIQKWYAFDKKINWGLS